MDTLGRYYTEDVFSKLLVCSIKSKSPNLIIDLGIGDGSLTKAAYNKWSSATFYGIDIDKNQVKKTKEELPFVKIDIADGAKSNLNKNIKIKVGSVDIAICNPPYLKIEKTKKYDRLFNQAGLSNCNQLRYVTSDLIFLAHNLRLLKTGGFLGIILPDGLLTSHDFKVFREDLIKNHTIKSIIQLPDNIFHKTEARTHILILQKGKQKIYKYINLLSADTCGVCVSKLKVLTNKLICRMDYNFHNWESQQNHRDLTLGSIGADIRRGSFSYKELKDFNCRYFHTTSFMNKSNHYFKMNSYDVGNKLIAECNDILIARVGKRCIGKFTVVRRGSILLSDCVYRLRVNKEHLQIVLKALNSEKGREWFVANSHGVCALVISKKDLLSFPLYC